MLFSENKARDLMESNTYHGPDMKLFVRDVRDRQGRKRAIMVRSWSTIKDVKHKIQEVLHVPLSAQSLYFGPLLTSKGELPNHRTLHDAGIYRSGETLLLVIKGVSTACRGLSACKTRTTLSPSTATGDICVSSSMSDSTPKHLCKVFQQARRGFFVGIKPDFVLDGSGGCYFLHDARKVKVGVFKPADEEPYAENNPRGYLPDPNNKSLCLREGVKPGELCIREVAAYLLDHDGFSSVPMTTLAEARHTAFNTNGSKLKVSEGGAAVGRHSIHSSPQSKVESMKKVGSFQEFCRSECTMDDISPSLISVEEVHKIAILDIRIMNGDRNSANLLCRRNQDNSLELVPIDHGYSLRSVADVSWMDWCWLDWPQLKQPLSEKSKAYIKNLDIEADARLLRERLNVGAKAIDYFRASSRFLKAGVQAGLSLYDIACMCCRNDDLGELPSKLEMLFGMASELALSAIENGRWHHAAASRALVEQLTPQHGGAMASMGSQMRRCASTAQFKTNFIASFDDFKSGDSNVPSMTPSSVSDSGSEPEDCGASNENLDCDEWAAALIADVSLDRTAITQTPTRNRKRSVSICSTDSFDSCLSESAKGFWHTSPGCHVSDSEDEDSVCWSDSAPSSGLSLDNDIYDSSTDDFPNFLDETETETERDRTVSFLMDEVVSNDQEAKLRSRPSFTGTKSDNLSSFESNKNVTFVMSQNVLSRPFGRADSGASGISRSKSYSALSSSIQTSKDDSTGPMTKKEIPEPSADDFDEFRDYFLKFVDLVITRETTAASSKS